MGGQKALCMAGSLESLRLPFSSSRRLVWGLGPIVQVATLSVFHVRHDFTLRRGIAPRCVRYHRTRGISRLCRKLMKEPLGRLGAPLTLHKDVKHVAILVNGPSEIVQPTLDANKHLIQMPLVAGSGATALQRRGEHPTKADAPLTDVFIADDNATFGQDPLDIAEAQAEAVIKPNGMLDDLARKAAAPHRALQPLPSRRCRPGFAERKTSGPARRQREVSFWFQQAVQYCGLAVGSNGATDLPLAARPPRSPSGASAVASACGSRARHQPIAAPPSGASAETASTGTVRRSAASAPTCCRSLAAAAIPGRSISGQDRLPGRLPRPDRNPGRSSARCRLRCSREPHGRSWPLRCSQHRRGRRAISIA